MEKLYGPEQIRKFLKYEMDRYLRARGSERLEELPLSRVENQGYIHYQKGGAGDVPASRRKSVSRWSMEPCRRLLGASSPSSPRPTRTHGLPARAARGGGPGPRGADRRPLRAHHPARREGGFGEDPAGSPDGRWETTLDVKARKLYVDGKGKETATPLGENFEVGVCSRVEPGKKGFVRESVLAFERRPLRDGEQQIVAAQRPRSRRSPASIRTTSASTATPTTTCWASSGEVEPQSSGSCGVRQDGDRDDAVI
jgi:hypothetical protein